MASTQIKKDKVEPGIRGFLGEHLTLLRANFGFSGFERNCLYRNRGNGTYQDVSGVSGIDSIHDGRAAVFFDYDNDGDLDLFVRSMHGPAHFLYRNESPNAARAVRLTLRGIKSGRDAYGAVVRVLTDRDVLTRIKSGGEGFLGQHDPRLTFALGTREVRGYEVFWPSGVRQEFRAVPGRDEITLIESR